ncbi:glycosyltransferase family 2 protein [Desulfurococcus mucosus]|uniref:Glycosyl transferase family 2 n=1 Tax=Desulfurococcus mucosus (strain ATCC 35584 / DSM 2162 / JCM 9187 / O7/1) TaxID=765177 RepID=E8R8B6_DESM0|nr:glycosyltransferase [Desulfurococcus mucosus]ADV64742.1 glycosyl transferase family 2 [Desulfurococcus mucosus DSM 2162]
MLTTGTHERLGYLRLLLRSLSRQTMRPSEIIVASEVSDRELLETVKRECGDTCMVLATGLWNKCRTANRAILESRGDIVFLLEDDLVLREDFIEEVVKTFDRDGSIGCVYSRCVWVFREGARSRGGPLGLATRLLSKLSVHESLLPRQVRTIDRHLAEIPVFTMSVACRREALLRAGLYDESVEEPIQGEDFDLAMRVRAAGYRIVANGKAVSYHFTRQVSKRVERLRRDPRHIEGVYRSEVYFLAKNRGLVGLYVVPHAIYRAIEAVAWAARSGRPSTALYGVRGIMVGLVKGCVSRGAGPWRSRSYTS